MIDVGQIAGDLRRLGLQAGDTVLVHSSLSSLGPVRGGASSVIAALLEVVSPAGTLLFPSFHWGDPYDPALPTTMGAIAEASAVEAAAQSKNASTGAAASAQAKH